MIPPSSPFVIPLQKGPFSIRNRIAMASMTRERADCVTGVPTPLLQQYYDQRSGAGIVMTECAVWSQRGESRYGAACLYNQAQAAAWRPIVDSLHKRNTLIFLQTSHSGRRTHPKLNKGLQVWGVSAIKNPGKLRRLSEGQEMPIPIEMTIPMIEQTLSEFKQSMFLAKETNFDGIVIHALSESLIEQFLKQDSNQRQDSYGGSIENRCRFLLRLVDIAAQVLSPQRVGVKITNVTENGVLTPMMQYLLPQLSQRSLGIFEFRYTPNEIAYEQQNPKFDACSLVRAILPITLLIANESFNADTAARKIHQGNADVISFGRLYIANPDLAERLIEGKPVSTQWDSKTFYYSEPRQKGYVDYPTYIEQKDQKPAL